MMNKKEKYILIALGAINTIICTLLTIFAINGNIPVLFDFNEKVAFVGTKWIMLISGIIPWIFIIFALISKSRPAQFWNKFMFAMCVFENMLWFIYFCLSKNLFVGAKSEISFAISVFFPASFAVMCYGLKLKNPTYKQKTGLNFAAAETTEFIWTQTHIRARYVFFFVGFLLFLISLIFSFFHISYILIGVFALALGICYLHVWKYAKSMVDKYNEMKTRKDNLEKTKHEQAEEKAEDEPQQKKSNKTKKNTEN